MGTAEIAVDELFKDKVNVKRYEIAKTKQMRAFSSAI